MTTTPLWMGLFSEGSGTTVADTSAGTPVNLTITPGATGAWATNVAGNEYGWGAASQGWATATASGTKLSTALNSTQQFTLVSAVSFSTGFDTAQLANIGLSLFVAGPDDFWDLLVRTDHGDVRYHATINGTNANYGAPPTPTNGYHVCGTIVDTPQATAANRARYFFDGFEQALTAETTIPQNGTLPNALAIIEVGALSGTGLTVSNFGIAAGLVYSSALTPSNMLSLALRLFATNDADPNTAGATLVAASTNGGTNDTSTGTGDHTISFTITIGAASSNRKVGIQVDYFGVTTGVTAITFNGSATGVHLSAQQQTTFASLAGCDYYEILDADLPAAGTYTVSVTVDGAAGVVCGTPAYYEGMRQNYATNTGLATGTGTSITATLAGSASAGSIIAGQMLDVSFGDAPVSGNNQLRLINQATSSVISQTADAKYVPSAGSNSMSWTGLTTATGKIAIAIELQKFSAAVSNESLFFGAGTTS